MSDYVNNKVDGDLMEASDLEAIETASATKSNKIVSPTSGNVIEQDASGDLVDAGVATANLLVDADIGVNVQAYDAGLLSIAGLTTAADKMIYATALDTYAVADLAPFARTILDDTSGGAVRITIGAVGVTGNEVIGGNKEFTGQITLARSQSEIFIKDSDSTGSNAVAFLRFVDSIDTSLGFLGFTSIDSTLRLGNQISSGDVDITTSGGDVTINGAVALDATDIGVSVQAWDTQLDDIAALAVTDGNFIVGDGVNWTAESGQDALSSLGIESKAKTVSTSRSSTTTPAADPQLAGWTIAVDTRVKIEGYLKVDSSSSTPDIKVQLTASASPQASQINFHAIDLSATETVDSAPIGTAKTFPLAASIALGAYFTGFLLSNASSVTTLDLDWAQGTSDASSTIISKGSWMTVTVLP